MLDCAKHQGSVTLPVGVRIGEWSYRWCPVGLHYFKVSATPKSEPALTNVN